MGHERRSYQQLAGVLLFSAIGFCASVLAREAIDDMSSQPVYIAQTPPLEVLQDNAIVAGEIVVAAMALGTATKLALE